MNKEVYDMLNNARKLGVLGGELSPSPGNALARRNNTTTDCRVEKIKNGWIVYIDGSSPNDGVYCASAEDVGQQLTSAIACKELA